MILVLALTSAILSHTDVNVVLLPDRDTGRAHLRVAIYSGSAGDPAGKEGLAWATAQALLDRAAPGGPLDGLTVRVDRDLTLFAVPVEARSIGTALDALGRLLTAPIDRGPENGPLVAGAGDAQDTVEETFDAILFMGHPHAHPPEGTPRSRAALTGQDLADFHADHYRKGNLAIGIAGAAGSDILERARTAFDPLGDGEPDRERRPLSYPTVPRVHVIEVSGARQASVRIGLPLAVTRGHPDHAGLLLAARCLDAESRRADIRIGSDRLGRRAGALRVAIEAAPPEAAEAVRDAVTGLVRLSLEGVDADCLAAAGAGLQESMRDLTPARLLDLRLSEFLHGDGGHLERLPSTISETDPEAVRTAASKHLTPGRLVIVAFVPDAESFIRQIASMQVEGWRPLRLSDFETTSPERSFRQGGF